MSWLTDLLTKITGGLTEKLTQPKQKKSLQETLAPTPTPRNSYMLDEAGKTVPRPTQRSMDPKWDNFKPGVTINGVRQGEVKGENSMVTALTGTPIRKPTPTPISYEKRETARNPAIDRYVISDKVGGAIRSAAEKYGVPSSLLYDIALQESSFDPNPNPNPESTASGLFQFTSPTWGDITRWMGIPANSDRTDPQIAANAAAWAISNGLLSKWDASKDVWGQYYQPEELTDYYVPFYQRQ